MKPPKPTPAALVFPLYAQKKLRLSLEEKQAARALIRKHGNEPAMREVFNLIERATFRLQGEGIAPGATAHEQGQAYGALYVYGLLRAVLEGSEGENEE